MQPAPRFQPPHTKNIIHCPRQNCGRIHIDFLGTTLRPSQLRSACCHCWLLALHVLLLLAASAHAAGSQHRSYAGAVVGRTYGVKRSAAHHSHDSCKRCGRCAVAWRCTIICALAARGLGQRATTWTSSCTTVDASAALSFSVTRLLSRAINICRSYSPMITPSCDFGNHVAVATAGYVKLKLLH